MFIKYFLTFCAIIFGQYSFVKSINLDSCILVLKTSKDDTNKVLLLNKIAWNIAYKNLQEGLDYSIQSYDLAKK